MANIVTMSITLVTILVLVAIREGINNNKTYKAKLRGIPVPGELIAVSFFIGSILHWKLWFITIFKMLL